jgi:CheY-like chemotaxis protein
MSEVDHATQPRRFRPAALDAGPSVHRQDAGAAGLHEHTALLCTMPVNVVLAEAMLRHLGHAPKSVHNGLQALQALQADAWGLVLMDMQMPELDGIGATVAVRAQDAPAARIPIVAMAAKAGPEDRQACLAAGMDDYLSKPLDLAALPATLERFVPGAAGVDRSCGAQPQPAAAATERDHCRPPA